MLPSLYQAVNTCHYGVLILPDFVDVPTVMNRELEAAVLSSELPYWAQPLSYRVSAPDRISEFVIIQRAKRSRKMVSDS